MSYSKSNTISKKWQHVLSELVCQAEQIAQSNQRQRTMSAEQLVQTLVLGCLESESASLRLFSEVATELGCDITASSINERLNSRAVMLLHEVLQLSIQRQINIPSKIEGLESFVRVVLYDSTSISLPNSLKQAFREVTIKKIRVR